MNNESAKLMEENLIRVWSERDEMRRIKAIESLYAKDAALYHVNDRTDGREAINKNVSSVISEMPPDFVFSVLKPIIINNNLGRLIWGLGPEGKPSVATGMDIVVFENEKIKSLYVFFD